MMSPPISKEMMPAKQTKTKKLQLLTFLHYDKIAEQMNLKEKTDLFLVHVFRSISAWPPRSFTMGLWGGRVS